MFRILRKKHFMSKYFLIVVSSYLLEWFLVLVGLRKPDQWDALAYLVAIAFLLLPIVFILWTLEKLKLK